MQPDITITPEPILARNRSQFPGWLTLGSLLLLKLTLGALCLADGVIAIMI